MVVVDDEDIIKVHVHTNDPGKALSEGVKYGQFETVKVENMRIQHANAGWVEENGHSMLVSNGVGCSVVNLRWGAPAQAHLITLYRAQDSAGGL